MFPATPFLQATGEFSESASHDFTAEDANGSQVDGSYLIIPDGTWTWSGDAQGFPQGGNWWTPTDGVLYAFHVRLVRTGGANLYNSTGSTPLFTWTPVSDNPIWRFRMAASGLSQGRTLTENLTLHYSIDGGNTDFFSLPVNVTCREDAV